MVFIVEMGWGRPPQLVVYGLDDDGELVPTKVIPTEGPFDPQWRHFSCHGQVWKALLSLGRQYGWQPSGTVPADSSRERWEKLGRIDSGYEPADWSYLKQVTAQDASAFADALEKALPLGHLAADERPTNPPMLLVEGMTIPEFIAANRGISDTFLREFISFLRKGPFCFAWDD